MSNLNRPLLWRPEYSRLRYLRDVRLYITILLFVGAVFLVTYKLPYYPKVFFDEGWFMQIPTNVARYGQYATHSSEGFRPYDTVVSGSPLFYLPMAGVFKIWGVGIAQARAVVAVWFLGACLFLFLIAKKLYGFQTAAIALAFFLLMGNDDVGRAATLGRMVMGEIPGLCMLFAGIYTWLWAFDGKTNLRLILAGILLGIALTIKIQFMLIVIPALVTLALIDRFYYREKRFQYFLIPFVTVLGALILHYALIRVILGPENFTRFLQEMSASSGPQVRTLLNPRGIVHALGTLLSDGSMAWFLAGLAYMISRCVAREPHQIKHCMLWVLAAGWTAWFLIATPGWGRYLFPATAVGFIMTARFVKDALSLVWQKTLSTWKNPGSEHWTYTALALSLSVFIVMSLTVSSASLLRSIVGAPTLSDQREFADYIDQYVQPDQVIATWEWDIIGLTKHENYNIPPLHLFGSTIARTWLGSTDVPPTYDFMQYRPDYIVIGTFYPVSMVYRPQFLEQQCVLIVTIGDYKLYRVKY